MSKMIICKKCNKWDQLKIVTPYNEEGYWLKCERCNKGQRLPDNNTTLKMFQMYNIYVSCLSRKFLIGELNLRDIKEIVWTELSLIEGEKQK